MVGNLAPTIPGVSVPMGTTMTCPLRVLIGADTCPPDINGAARFTTRLAAGLARRGHDVHVLALSDTGAAPSPVQRDAVPAVRRLRSYRVPGQGRFRLSARPGGRGGAAGAAPGRRARAVALPGRARSARGRVRGQVPDRRKDHFMPENMLRHAQVPDVLADRVSRWAWRDLAHVDGAADVVALPHLVHNGLLHRPGDVAGLAAALTALLDDPATRVRMGASGWKVAAAHDAALDAFEDVYSDVRRGAAGVRVHRPVAGER